MGKYSRFPHILGSPFISERVIKTTTGEGLCKQTNRQTCKPGKHGSMEEDGAAGRIKVIYRSIHMYALKHFGMVWRSLSLSISIIILRGPFEEQLGKLAMNIKEFQKIRAA
jgi:hypothetical protein